jgi:hypothetical protein
VIGTSPKQRQAIAANRKVKVVFIGQLIDRIGYVRHHTTGEKIFPIGRSDAIKTTTMYRGCVNPAVLFKTGTLFFE